MFHLRAEPARVKARRSGLSLSEYCRRAAFDDRIIERLSEDQIAMYKMLVEYRNNFIRIGNMYKRNGPETGRGSPPTGQGNTRPHPKFQEMIGKGKSIAHARASIEYGWNQEKGAEIVHSQFVSGESPKEISEEFKIVQEQNTRCQKNTLSFILSPTIGGREKPDKKTAEGTDPTVHQGNGAEGTAGHRLRAPGPAPYPCPCLCKPDRFRRQGL